MGSPPRFWISLGLNVVLAAAVGAIAIRRWSAPEPAGSRAWYRAWHAERVSVFQALPRRPGAIVFLGDSLVERGPWGELFEVRGIVNRGIAGDTVGDVVERADAIAAASPAAIFLMVGVNDLEAGAAPAAVAEAYDRLLAKLRARAPGAAIHVQSVLPVHEARANGKIRNADIAALNDALRAIAAKHGARWLDVAFALADEVGQLDARFTDDGVHLRGEGYVAWAKAIAAAVEGRGEAR